MRAPAFWYQPPGLLAKLLAPLGHLYARQTAKRLAGQEPVRLDIPVICVGNLDAGGTGKTPAVVALVELLKARGLAPHIVTRGYGGTVIGPKIVSERDDLAEQVGDEPLLLSNFATTWVARDRGKGGLAAQKAGADLVVMDDGFQNPALHKDLSIIVADAGRGFGNGHVIPAGPLREPVATGLSRADLVLAIGPPEAQARFEAQWGDKIRVPRLAGVLTPLETGMDWAGTRAIAFAGIGHPAKFFDTLEALGVDLVKTEALADHQALSERLLQRLLADAANLGAQLVTTEKDAARLPARYRAHVLTLPVRLSIEKTSALEDALAGIF